MATRTTLKNRINRILQKQTDGRYNDDSWVSVHAAFRALDDFGYETDITDTKYGKDEDGVPCRKTWTFEVQSETKKPFYGILTAHGCGSVEDPLSVYDITAYVS